MEEYPLFTVIIPQKNRAEYLIHTLKTCMIQEYPNFEVIVSDDCSDDNSVEVAQECAKKDPRIKVFPHEKHLGMRDNFEFALNQVRQGYVIALGGDDGLVAGGIQRMYELIKETGRDVLTWNTAYFMYPNEEGGKPKFLLKRDRDRGVKIIRSEDFLNKVADTLQYQKDDCPMFYMKGVVATYLIERVKSRTPDGCFYYCPTPDGFSGIAIVGEVEDYAYTKEPLTIAGTSKKSISFAYKSNDKEQRHDADEFFKDSTRKTMHEQLASQPYCPLTSVMTADYLLTARDLPGWPGKFEMFTMEKLLRVTFASLVKATYPNEALVREMHILKAIAEQHNLLPLFDELMKTTKRKYVRTEYFDGFVITPRSLMFDGSELGINNIYDAALATKYFYNFTQSLKFKEILGIIKRSFKTIMNSRNYKVEKLPQI